MEKFWKIYMQPPLSSLVHFWKNYPCKKMFDKIQAILTKNLLSAFSKFFLKFGWILSNVGGPYGVGRRRGGTTILFNSFFVLAYDFLHHSL